MFLRTQVLFWDMNSDSKLENQSRILFPATFVGLMIDKLWLMSS